MSSQYFAVYTYRKNFLNVYIISYKSFWLSFSFLKSVKRLSNVTICHTLDRFHNFLLELSLSTSIILEVWMEKKCSLIVLRHSTKKPKSFFNHFTKKKRFFFLFVKLKKILGVLTFCIGLYFPFLINICVQFELR